MIWKLPLAVVLVTLGIMIIRFAVRQYRGGDIDRTTLIIYLKAGITSVVTGIILIVAAF